MGSTYISSQNRRLCLIPYDVIIVNVNICTSKGFEPLHIGTQMTILPMKLSKTVH